MKCQHSLERYRQVVSESELRPNSNARYWQANAFVRWLKGEFTPGTGVETNGYLTRSATLDIDDSL